MQNQPHQAPFLTVTAKSISERVSHCEPESLAVLPTPERGARTDMRAASRPFRANGGKFEH